MNIRCKRCHLAMVFRADTEPDRCGCGQTYRLKKPLTDDRRERLGLQARALVRKHDIDLPAAYSITLGILTLEQVRDVQGATSLSPASDVEETEETAGELNAAAKYDRAFQGAVDGGFLTPMEAMARGRREVLVAKIAERHQLSESLAHAVADNRTPLLVALRQQDHDLQPVVVPTIEQDRPWSVLVKCGLAAVAMAALAFGVWAWQEARGTGDGSGHVMLSRLPVTSGPADHGGKPIREKALRGATSVERDDQGRVIRIVGPDPRSVTIAFCETSGPARRYEVLDVTPSIPAETRLRLGLVRDLDKRSFHTLAIHQDRQSRRWITGDGQMPVSPKVAPEAVLAAASKR